MYGPIQSRGLGLKGWLISGDRLHSPVEVIHMFDPTWILLQMGPHHGPHWGPTGGAGGVGGAGGALWGPLWLLLTGLVLAVGVYVVFRILRRQQTSTDADDAAKILQRRYANGEIDEEVFERRRNRLSVPHQP